MSSCFGERILRWGCRGIVGAFLCLGVVSCTPERTLEQRATEAYEKAKAAMLREPAVEVDVAWLLQELLTVAPDAELQELVNSRRSAFAGHPYLLLLDPAAPRIPLPANPGRGMDRYFVYMQAPFGAPEELAVRYIADYLSHRQSGYILTHQFTSLLWAEKSGLELPAVLTDMKDGLLEQIRAEQADEAGVFIMDLYAERVAFLLYYGEVSDREARAWISKLVEMQISSGNWPGSQAVLVYENQFGSSAPPASHTTSLAMLALKVYLTQYL